MPLPSNGVAKLIRGQDWQSIPNRVRDRLGEDLESDRIVESAGGLQIELRSLASQHCLTAQNDVPRMHTRRKLGESNRHRPAAKAVIGARNRRAESSGISKLKSILWILISS